MHYLHAPHIIQVYLRRAASSGNERQLLRLLKHCRAPPKSVQTPTGDAMTLKIPPPRSGRLVSRDVLSPTAILPNITDPMFAIDLNEEGIPIYKDVVLVSGC